MYGVSEDGDRYCFRAEDGDARVVGRVALPDGESDGHVFAEGRGDGVEDMRCLFVRKCEENRFYWVQEGMVNG